MTTASMAAPADTLTEKPRISSIDIMRGAVMVIMALDHVRDFFHQGALTSDPTNMDTTTPAIFFTRWITHLCAPTFVLLAGTSIFLSSQRKSKSDLSKFLLTRGFWLIVLEFTVIRFGFFFNFYYDVTMLQVIWAIGSSMIVMSALVHLPRQVVLIVGALIVLIHNVADIAPLKPEDSFYTTWVILRQTGFLPITENFAVIALYPVLPWLGIMMLGYSLGQLYTKNVAPEKRQKTLVIIGSCAIALFIVLRLLNVYGDPSLWKTQNTPLFTFMSFMNGSKYPPSLLYVLMTLGPVMIMLSLIERVQTAWLKPLTVFGRVPLFYFILHFYLIHAISLLLFMNKTGRSLAEVDFHFNKSFGGITAEGGYSLTWAYVAWILIVLSLYPVCKWYDRYKSTHKQWWLSYL